jgi:hypothetical protein
MNWKNITKDCPTEGQQIIAYTTNSEIIIGYWNTYENRVCAGDMSWMWSFTHWMDVEPPNET